VLEGDTIAIIDYDILEYVEGDFTMPSFMGNETSTELTENKFVFKGQGVFSVTEGKWLSYHALVTLNMSGFMNANMKQQWSLIEF